MNPNAVLFELDEVASIEQQLRHLLIKEIKKYLQK